MRFDFKKEIQARFALAAARGAESVIINSGDLHRTLGGYPGKTHQMPVCCQVMYKEQRAGDLVIAAPPKGQGATLSIEYSFPVDRFYCRFVSRTAKIPNHITGFDVPEVASSPVNSLRTFAMTMTRE